MALHKDIYGLPYTGYFTTQGTLISIYVYCFELLKLTILCFIGDPLPRVKNLSVSLTKANVVSVTWDAPMDKRTPEWKFGVFYGKSVSDIVSNGK